MAVSLIPLASAVTGTLPDANAPTGSVLQVVQNFYKTAETTSTSTWAATALSATITPTSSTSKIMVMVTVVVSTSVDNYGGFRLYRNNAEVTGATSNQSPGTPPNAFIAIPPTNSTNWTYTLSNNYLDSPASTSAQTYTMWWARTYNSGNIYLNRPTSIDSGNTYTVFAPSSITLLEVAA